MKRYAVMTLLFAVTLPACNVVDSIKENATSQNLSTAGGVAAGALLGNYLCRDKNSNDRAACTVLAGAAGGMMARKIYDTLHEEDRPRMQEETNAILVDDAPQAAPHVWSNPNTGLKASVVVKQETKQQVLAPVKVLKGPISIPPSLELIGEIYTVSVASTNVRGGPGTEYQVIGAALPKGTEVGVIGRVESNRDWLLYGAEGIGSGYVYAPNLTPAGKAIPALSQSTAADVATVQVPVQQTCKTLEQTVEYPDKPPVKETVRMCQQTDGSWVFV
jgi:surface antigen